MLSRMNEYLQQPNDSEAYIPSLLSFKSHPPPESKAQILIQANQERIHFLPAAKKHQRNLNFMSNSLRFKEEVQIDSEHLGPGKYVGVRPAWNKKSYNRKFQNKGAYFQVDFN